jgi:hypothetical protein
LITTYAASDPGGSSTAYSVTYWNYAAVPSSVSKFACAVSNLKPGDFVQCDVNSNWTIADSSDSFQEIMGQVLEIEDVFDKDALSRVRTAYASLSSDATGSLPAYAGQLDQMPGSANGGVTDKVHMSGAANLVVRINLISR